MSKIFFLILFYCLLRTSTPKQSRVKKSSRCISRFEIIKHRIKRHKTLHLRRFCVKLSSASRVQYLWSNDPVIIIIFGSFPLNSRRKNMSKHRHGDDLRVSRGNLVKGQQQGWVSLSRFIISFGHERNYNKTTFETFTITKKMPLKTVLIVKIIILIIAKIDDQYIAGFIIFLNNFYLLLIRVYLII